MASRIFRRQLNFLAILAVALYIPLVFATSDVSTDKFDMLNYVNPLIGTANGGLLVGRLDCTYQQLIEMYEPLGHVFAGATLPFGEEETQLLFKLSWQNLTKILGMAKAVADTVGENQAGFAEDTTDVTGFSHMHDSGTGGVCDAETSRTDLVD